MRLCWFLPIALITIFVALTTGCLQKSNQKLIVATATNIQFAMKELTRSFAEVQQYVDTVRYRCSIECVMVISSSGKLTAQIKEGTPFDIIRLMCKPFA